MINFVSLWWTGSKKVGVLSLNGIIWRCGLVVLQSCGLKEEFVICSLAKAGQNVSAVTAKMVICCSKLLRQLGKVAHLLPSQFSKGCTTVKYNNSS